MRKVLWGIFFIAMAVLLVVSQLIEMTNIFNVGLTIFVGAILIESIIAKNMFFSLLSMSIIFVINKEAIGLSSISSISIIIAAILISIGFSIIFNKKKKYDFKEEISYDESDIVDVNVSFGSTIKYITSDDFKKAKINSNFAGAQIYFDNAIIKGDEAIVEFDVSFSGIELYVPKTWKIINNVNVTLGGIEEKHRSGETNKKLILTGKVNLSGIEIRYI